MIRHSATILILSWSAAGAAGAAACGSTQSQDGAVRAPVVRSADAAALVAKADDELTTTRALDYRAPRNREARSNPFDRAFELLYEACKRGERSACWRYIELPYNYVLLDMHQAGMEVSRHCVAGDGLSCRALTSWAVRNRAFSHEASIASTQRLCNIGVAAACTGASDYYESLELLAERNRWLQKACDLGDGRSCSQMAIIDRAAGKPEEAVAALEARAMDRVRAECNQGYAHSCSWLMMFHDGDVKRVEETAEEGCRAGLIEECDLLTRSKIRPALRAYASEQLCALRGEECDTLAELRTAPIGKRDADLADYLCREWSRDEACAYLPR